MDPQMGLEKSHFQLPRREEVVQFGAIHSNLVGFGGVFGRPEIWFAQGGGGQAETGGRRARPPRGGGEGSLASLVPGECRFLSREHSTTVCPEGPFPRNGKGRARIALDGPC